MTSNLPRYRDAARTENGRRILKALAEAGGVASYSTLEARSGVKSSVVNHYLNMFQALNILEKEARGTYRLVYKTPLCFLFEEKAATPVIYLGLLGRRLSRAEMETQVALQLLEAEGVSPKLIYVATSPEALNEWKDLKPPYQWLLCYEEEIIDIDSVKERVAPQLESLLRDYIVILDCTSATKPATIAYYELAQTYLTPLIYVYEETREMKWLISKETLRRRLGVG
jgi:hypothetical protein